MVAWMATRYPHGGWFLVSGLACLLILTGSMTAWFGARWLAPAQFVQTGPGADEDLVTGVFLGAGFALLSLLSPILLLIGLDEMRLTYPEVGRRISRRIGPVLVTPIWGVIFLLITGLVSLVAEVQARYAGAASLLGRSALLATGTFLILASEEALRPLASRNEGRLVFAAGMAALFGGLLMIGSGIVAFFLVHELFPPPAWASVPGGLCATFALVVLVRAAWIVASRWERTPMAPWMASV